MPKQPIGKSLLEKAMDAPSMAKRYSKFVGNQEVEEMAAAWANGIVASGQCAEALGTTVPNIDTCFSRVIRRAIAEGRMKLTYTGKKG